MLESCPACETRFPSLDADELREAIYAYMLCRVCNNLLVFDHDRWRLVRPDEDVPQQVAREAQADTQRNLRIQHAMKAAWRN